MFVPRHRLDAPRAHASNSAVEPFASFDALFSRLRDIGCDGCTGTMLWRHALETAGLARRAEAGDALISAALLHLVGPMVWLGDEAVARDIPPSGFAHFGADLLAELYAPVVTEPIRLQASAQRFLARSTPPMLHPIQRMAGVHGTSTIQPMTEQERECFAAMPFARDAIRLSRWSHSATGAGGVERSSAGSLRRIAARSVCNDGFRWESSRQAADLHRATVAFRV